ncbi:WSC domain-containing protein [Lactarius indigo]|nr:WSC domain-containing protein [Lactarius indigo]
MRMIYPRIYPSNLLPAGFLLAVLLAMLPSISAYSYPEFLGCVTDGFLRSATFKDPVHMTARGCALFCFNRGYLYAGVENNEDCYCGKDWPESAKIVSSDRCNVKCTGDSSENCGGSGYLDLYWTLMMREENPYWRRNGGRHSNTS